MPEVQVLRMKDLPVGKKKVVEIGETDILLIHQEGGIVAVQAKCPHAGAPLEEGAVCNGRLICPWHLGTFALPSGELLEPPAMESLQTFSVRVVGEDIYVNPEPLPRVHAPVRQQHSETVFLIVGGGAGGSMAAATLRQHGFAGKIMVVEPLADEPLDRTQLSKDALGGKMPLDKIALDVYSEIDVEVVHGRVIELSAATREARLNDSSVIKFDKAMLATGGTPKRLQIPGTQLAQTLRHSQDVRAILKATETMRRVAIVGTSFIGLEAASALVEKGLQVTVVGKEKLPFAKQFGERVAKSLKAFHESKGTKFRLGVEIEEIDSEGVTVRDGNTQEKIAAEVVILGVGVTPELSFKHDLPIAEDGGIAVGPSLQAVDNVWVAGDIASVDGIRNEHWRVAQQHGRTAALRMIGKDPGDAGVPFFWTYHFGKRLGYLGHAEDWDEIIFEGDVDRLEFIAVYVKAEEVKAVLQCGFETQMAALAEPMRQRLLVSDALSVIKGG